MASEFLLLFGCLNLLFLSKEKKKEIYKQIRLKIIKTTKLFEYKKSNEN